MALGYIYKSEYHICLQDSACFHLKYFTLSILLIRNIFLQPWLFCFLMIFFNVRLYSLLSHCCLGYSWDGVDALIKIFVAPFYWIQSMWEVYSSCLWHQACQYHLHWPVECDKYCKPHLSRSFMSSHCLVLLSVFFLLHKSGLFYIGAALGFLFRDFGMYVCMHVFILPQHNMVQAD